MKNCTDIEQSRKLAEILRHESADMIWVLANPDLPMIKAIAYKDSEKSKYYETLPAWSLAALLDVISNYSLQTTPDGTVFVVCESGWKPIISNDYDNPVDACYEMILKLNELKMI